MFSSLDSDEASPEHEHVNATSSDRMDRLKQFKQNDVVEELQFAKDDHVIRKRQIETLSDSDDEPATNKKKPKPLFYGNEQTRQSTKRKFLTDNEQAEPPTKKRVDIAQRLMEKMGHRPGEGLGANKQGISKPIELAPQRGRTGFGHEGGKVLKHDPTLDWDDSEEKKTVEEAPVWIPAFADEEDNTDQATFESRQYEVTRVVESGKEYLIAKKKMTIDDEVDVMDKDLLHKLLNAKNVFDNLNDRALREARARANPYETIASGIFQNRAAMKAANIDAVFNFCFSQEDVEYLEEKCPLDIQKSGSNARHRDDDLFYFADVCAGPGGFSEYELWRKGFFNAKGFGFTLKGKDDFKLTKFLASSPLYFEPYYGFHDDGDVTKPKNIDSFEEVVMKGTDGLGVHLMMADGGFSVEGQENIQEILSKRIYLCQLLVSLCIVREGGNFYCKLFDIFTRFSYELVFLMRLCYRDVCIHKPHTSRPANSERYIVCKGLMRRFSEPIKLFLKNVNRELENLGREDKGRDILQMLPHHFGNELTDAERDFLEYMTDSNNIIAKRQIHYLDKYRAFATNLGLFDKDQADLRKSCMQYWVVPYDMQPGARSGINRQRENYSPELLLGKYAPTLYGGDNLAARPFEFEKQWKAFFYTNARPGQLVHEEYRCVWATEDKPGQARVKMPRLLVATPDAVYLYDSASGQFEKMDQFKYRVPGHSILLVELTQEMDTDERGKLAYPRGSDPTIIRIIDAAVLSADNISCLTYERRMRCVRKFCKAVNLVENEVHITVPIVRANNDRRGKNFDNRPRFERRSFVPLRLVPAEVFSFETLQDKLPRVVVFQNEYIVLIEEGGKTFKVSGMHVMKTMADGWSMHFSKKANLSYAFKPQPPASVFSDQFEARQCISSFWDTAVLKRRHYRMFWSWRNEYNASMYGARKIMEDETNEAGPTVREIERRVNELREAAGCNAASSTL